MLVIRCWDRFRRGVDVIIESMLMESFISEVAEIVALNLGEEIVDVALENDYLFLAVVLEFLCYIRFRNSFRFSLIPF